MAGLHSAADGLVVLGGGARGFRDFVCFVYVCLGFKRSVLKTCFKNMRILASFVEVQKTIRLLLFFGFLQLTEGFCRVKEG